MSGKWREKLQDFRGSFPSAALSYGKIVQMSGKRREKPQDFREVFSECRLYPMKRYGKAVAGAGKSFFSAFGLPAGEHGGYGA